MDSRKGGVVTVNYENKGEHIRSTTWRVLLSE